MSLNAKIITFAIIALALFIRLINGPHPSDDAFTTLHYAKNIVDNNGFVFNPSEQVLGTTTPLYTLVLAALYLPFRIELPWLALLVNCVADCATIFILIQLLRKLGVQNRWGIEYVAPLIFAIDVQSTSWCVDCMETSFFSFLLIATFYFTVGGKYKVGAIFASLCLFCRPEGLLIVALFLIAAWLLQKKLPWPEELIVLAVILPWWIFATLYFGSPVPQSLQAKSTLTYNSGNVYSGLRYFNMLIGDYRYDLNLTEEVKYPNPTIYYVELALKYLVTACFAGFGLLGAWTLWKLNRVLLSFTLAFILLYNGAYLFAIVFKHLRMFAWYLEPLTPWYLVLIGIGFTQAFAFLQERRGLQDKTKAKILLNSSLLVGFLLLFLTNQLQAYNWGRSREVSRGYFQSAASILAPYVKPSDTILAPEIGELGYYSKARIFDSSALISPEAATYYQPPINDQTFTKATLNMISALKPEYIVSLQGFLPDTIIGSDVIINNYKLIKTIDTSVFGPDDGALLIYGRNDTPIAKLV
jgi:hypothetical protein